jgi:hypothetical protein
MLPLRRSIAIAAVLFSAACTADGRFGPAAVGAAGGAFRAASGTTLVIANQHHKVYSHLTVATSSDDCVDVSNSTDITIEASQIGPCGGEGVSVNGGRDIRILDRYIHPETLSPGCCDYNDGVLVSGATRVTIEGNVIAYGETNVEAPQGGVSALTVSGNFLLNPRGPFPRGQNVQAWYASHVTVENNFALSSKDAKYLYPDDQEDSINVGQGSDFVAEGNYVTGGSSPSGCGIIADDGASDVRFESNRLLDTGQCGIGIASGTRQLVGEERDSQSHAGARRRQHGALRLESIQQRVRSRAGRRQRRNGDSQRRDASRLLGRRRVRSGDGARRRVERSGAQATEPAGAQNAGAARAARSRDVHDRAPKVWRAPRGARQATSSSSGAATSCAATMPRARSLFAGSRNSACRVA